MSTPHHPPLSRVDKRNTEDSTVVATEILYIEKLEQKSVLKEISLALH